MSFTSFFASLLNGYGAQAQAACGEQRQWNLAFKYATKLTQAGLVSLLLATANCTVALADQQSPRHMAPNALPPCNLDSFVHQAGAQAEYIFGDEGIGSKPPMAYFTKASRIDAGITGQRDAGLTTGHGSYMPDAWGADEYIAPPNGEWGQSGVTGNESYSNLDANLLSIVPDTTRTIGLPNSCLGNSFLTVPVNGQLSQADPAFQHLLDLSVAAAAVVDEVVTDLSH